MGTTTVKKVPKIQITEDTPRKFFKSKGKIADENSPPGFRTPKVPTVSTTAKKKSSASIDIFSIEETKPPIRNLKSISSNFEIFDDSQLKTPVKREVRSTSASSSVRKSRSTKKDELKDDVFTTPAPATSSRSRRTKSHADLEIPDTYELPASTSSKRSTRKVSTKETPSRSTKSRKDEMPDPEDVPAPSSVKRSSSRKIKTEIEETPSSATRSSKRLLKRL